MSHTWACVAALVWAVWAAWAAVQDAGAAWMGGEDTWAVRVGAGWSVERVAYDLNMKVVQKVCSNDE